jgi:flagellar hook assembly protein FlgD
VETGGKFILRNLLNYPNPISSDTKFTAEQNRPDQQLEVIITIYDLGGRAIRIIETTVFASGYEIPPVPWDGSVEGGKRAGRGIYTYRITVKTESGEKAEGSGRLIIL